MKIFKGYWRRYYLKLSPMLIPLFMGIFLGPKPEDRFFFFLAFCVLGAAFCYGFFVVAPYLDGEKK